MLANDSWQGQIKDGDHIQLTTMDGYTYKMYFNINHDNQAGYGYYVAPHIDMIGNYLIPTTSALRPSSNNNGTSYNHNPFKASDTIITFLNNYLNNIPSTLKSHIVSKELMVPRRYTPGVTNLTDDNGFVSTELPNLWIPFGTEVFGEHNCGRFNYTYENNLHQYHHFKNPLNLKKKRAGQTSYTTWWLASAYYDDYFNFCAVDDSGNFKYGSAGIPNGVPLCFRFR